MNLCKNRTFLLYHTKINIHVLKPVCELPKHENWQNMINTFVHFSLAREFETGSCIHLAAVSERKGQTFPFVRHYYVDYNIDSIFYIIFYIII